MTYIIQSNARTDGMHCSALRDTPNTPQARVPDYVFDHREPATIKLDLNLLLIFPGNDVAYCVTHEGHFPSEF